MYLTMAAEKDPYTFPEDPLLFACFQGKLDAHASE